MKGNASQSLRVKHLVYRAVELKSHGWPASVIATHAMFGTSQQLRRDELCQGQVYKPDSGDIGARMVRNIVVAVAQSFCPAMAPLNSPGPGMPGLDHCWFWSQDFAASSSSSGDIMHIHSHVY